MSQGTKRAFFNSSSRQKPRLLNGQQRTVPCFSGDRLWLRRSNCEYPGVIILYAIMRALVRTSTLPKDIYLSFPQYCTLKFSRHILHITTTGMDREVSTMLASTLLSVRTVPPNKYLVLSIGVDSPRTVVNHSTYVMHCFAYDAMECSALWVERSKWIPSRWYIYAISILINRAESRIIVYTVPPIVSFQNSR